MTVRLRGSVYHYRFMAGGKDYSGVCHGCATEKAAKEFEAKIRRESGKVRSHRSVAALVEEYKYELTGGSPIPLADGCRLAGMKPAKREPSAAVKRQNLCYWNDFAAFMEKTYPEVKHMAGVRKTHCEAYVRYLIDHGRFVKDVKYERASGKRGRKKTLAYRQDYKLSARTVRAVMVVCKGIFMKLAEDAGLVLNPWNGVAAPVKGRDAREIFSEPELELIRNGLQDDPFCKPLFLIAAATGLTEGDICTLRWSEVSFQSGFISHVRRKTGVAMVIPILAGMGEYLKSLPMDGEYVLPEHAAMYLNNSSGISYRVKKFLEGLGIVTTRKPAGWRAVSIKDLHSMRHVFCYYAGVAGVPLSTVQSIVGHMSPEMTKHYMSHTTAAEKQLAVKKLPALLDMSGGERTDDSARRKLLELARALPEDEVRAILARYPVHRY